MHPDEDNLQNFSATGVPGEPAPSDECASGWRIAWLCAETLIHFAPEEQQTAGLKIELTLFVSVRNQKQPGRFQT